MQGRQEHPWGSLKKIFQRIGKKNRSSLQTPPSCLRCQKGELEAKCTGGWQWCFSSTSPLTIEGSPVAVGAGCSGGTQCSRNIPNLPLPACRARWAHGSSQETGTRRRGSDKASALNLARKERSPSGSKGRTGAGAVLVTASLFLPD